MARKDLLKGLMDTPDADQVENAPALDTAPEPARVDPARPRYTKGAIGAVSQSIADLKSRSVTEIDPNLIDAAGLQDRLEYSEDENQALMHSIKTYGQQVPILVRPNPENPDRFQIVFGRRRVFATRDLGIKVKAMIRDLDDTELVMAQGQENTARKDLSFIEKANFARQMADAGYERKVICDAIHIDKTLISRMLSVAERVPIEVIEAIGAAHGIGRDRWLALADGFEKTDYTAEDALGMLGAAGGEKSEDRFEIILRLMERRIGQYDLPKKSNPSQPSTQTPLKSADGVKLGQASWGSGKMVLKLNTRNTGGFDEWLVDNLSEIYQDWKTSRGK